MKRRRSEEAMDREEEEEEEELGIGEGNVMCKSDEHKRNNNIITRQNRKGCEKGIDIYIM